MAHSQFRLIGRGLGALAAASLLAGVSLDAAAFGSKGTLYLQTGKSLSNFHFVYGAVKQDFALIKGCTVELDATDTRLAALTALRGGNPGVLGYMATSIGVYDGPQGTACGRVSLAKDEALRFALGDQLGSVASGANAFDRLELDVELKGDVVLRLDVSFNSRTVSYYLTAGAGSAPVGVPADKITTCSPSSDAGPDAGPGDNCRWEVNELGKSFTITPTLGEFSLEGGGDFADVLANRTAIYLTEADGIYDCGDTVDVTNTNTGFTCVITRLNPGDGSTCKAVPYVLRSNGSSCELTVDPQGQQMVANLFVTYDPEPTSGVKDDSGGNAGLLSTSWPNFPLSLVSFATNPGTTYPIPACVGATIKDTVAPTGGLLTIDPILEITSAVDRVPYSTSGNNFIEYACAIERHETLRTIDGSLKLLVEELIQFWGDIKFERF